MNKLRKILVVCKNAEDVQASKQDYAELLHDADYQFVDVNKVEKLNGEQAVFMSNQLLRTGLQREKELVVSLRNQIK
ncbi:hypothetical protein IV36_GL001917 [Liquorilactobacillus mali]|uniref:Uncharacterized protein n=1 Tax=Liquorilactobacillus mali TaxID=1618 RepID=A0A0R2FUG6_9LACO|nr:hypothetical protein IV36_GL001917 [Liquorilactobacillus mali]